MGVFFEQEKKSPESGSPRSRIPRLVLHPFRPKDKSSPLSDSQFSEEEGKECDLSSDHSKRTISTNSFCSGKMSSSRIHPCFGTDVTHQFPPVNRFYACGTISVSSSKHREHKGLA